MTAPITSWKLAGTVFLLLSTVASAQRREDLLSIQRDVAQLQDQVKQMQAGQDQKLAALESLLKQALEESGKVSASLVTLQQNLTERINEQQTKMVAPVAALGTKLDQSADELRSLRENIAELSSRFGSLDNKLADISSAVRTLSTPPAVPPPPASATATPEPPPGVSAESLYQNAYRDYMSGKDDLAMSEFADYLKYFSQTESAPAVQFYMGILYDRAKQYDDAVQAFDAVLERYPDNPKTPDALYYKGVDLMKGGHRTDAGAEFKEFMERFPTHSLASKAQAHLRELGLSPAPASRRTKKQ